MNPPQVYMCWRRLLRVPWTARRSNQSILRKISPGCSLEGLMLKLKLQFFGHLMGRVDSLEKTLMLGKLVLMLLRVPVWRLNTQVPKVSSKRPMRKGINFLIPMFPAPHGPFGL